ncbi:sodium/hydrogen exchanger 9B2-like [Tetranychus urticae]|uniref:Cation/H+ exchanger transmembrane domain-containing protein n=1 Tax=Tetranychus urticae TaxID=32264 RepID=T1KTN3_TETUR|nr:sodium/hydrogen exchanger 9B2-like [Tetranychus urticae]
MKANANGSPHQNRISVIGSPSIDDSISQSPEEAPTIAKKCISFITEWIIRAALCVLCWSLLWSICGPIALPPQSPLFSLLIIWITAYALGQCCLPFSLPPLLGMMIAGIILSNIPGNVIVLDSKISSSLRSIALTIILLRAGLGLDPKMIKSLSGVCFRLAFIPCLVEAVAIAITTHLIIGFPFQWGLLLGFVVGAVSPAVVVPAMIDLQQQGYGIEQGIPSLVIASSSVDDVLAITGFDVVLSFAFVRPDSSLVWNLVKGPGEALIGLIMGTLTGIFLWYFPRCSWKDLDSEETFDQFTANCQRFALTLTIGLASVFITNYLDIGGIGPLAALVVTFVAAIRWRPLNIDSQIEDGLKIAWLIFEPFLFSLIGAEIKFSQLKLDYLFPVTLCLIISLGFRCLASFLVLFGSELNLREKFFIAISWLPKATVQAAIGPVALDLARSRGDQQAIENGILVLTVAILSILLTAPIGAVLIKLSAPKLLRKPATKNTFEMQVS